MHNQNEDGQNVRILHRDLYDPQMDQNVDKILRRREQRELAKYEQREQLKLRKEQEEAQHAALLGPTPRPDDHDYPPILNSVVEKLDDNLLNLYEDDKEPALDWTEEEILALRRQVLAHKRARYPPPPQLPSARNTATDTATSNLEITANATSVPSQSTSFHSNAAVQVLQAEGKMYFNNKRPPSTTSSAYSARSTTSNVSTSSVISMQQPPIRTHTGTNYENKSMEEKRKRWQSIARSLGGSSGWYGRNFCECQWVWRVVKKRQAKIDAKQALNDQQRLKSKLSDDMVKAKAAHRKIYTTGGGNEDRPWTEEHLRQLEEVVIKFPPKMFKGDKRTRWKRIQAELGLPDRSYKSCQRASRYVNKLHEFSTTALNEFDSTRKKYLQSQVTYKDNILYLKKCNEKLRKHTKLISFQTHLNKQLRNVARIVNNELDTTGRPNQLFLLLQRGADPNASDRGGFSALMAAARQNACGNIEVLLKFGADINLADSNKCTPIMHAIEGGAAQAFELLLKEGAELQLDDVGSINAPGVWSKKIELLLRDFVKEKKQSFANTKRDTEWFRKFEKKMLQQKNGRIKPVFGRGKPPRSGGVVGGNIQRNNSHWPPKVTMSERLQSRGSIESRGSTARSTLPTLQPPSALEALHLGLEGSRQRKKRLKREEKETERQIYLAENPRPPTFERKMESNRQRAGDAIIEGTLERTQQTNALNLKIAMSLHRASTANR